MYSQRLREISARLTGNPLEPQWINHLLKLRHDVAQTFLTTPSDGLEQLYREDAGKAHAGLLLLEVAGYPAQSFENQLIARIAQDLFREPVGDGAVGRILAGMLYEGPHVLLSCEMLPTIPGWFLDDFLKYALGIPPAFKAEGEIERYHRHLSRWVSYLHTEILANRTSVYWQGVLRGLLNRAAFFPLYFSPGNLREIFRQRAELITYALSLSGLQTDFTFAPRKSGAAKVRFGVLAPSFAPRPETFATLPVYSHLDRKSVEVILIAPAARDKNPLETYCMSFADRLVEIPSGIMRAVETIRAIDLDAIWIATNVTSFASFFPYLAAHRLARTQIVGGCCPVTSGFRNVDAFVSGGLTEPPRVAQEHYTEKLMCMDGPFLCFDFGPGGNEQEPAQARDRASLGIPADVVVYTSGANFFKITPEMEKCWIRILAASSDSRLLLYPFNPNWKRNYQVGPILLRISETCKRFGVAGNRLIVIPPLPTITDVRATLEKTADIYLDSFPHSGMTSLIDALLVGVPTVVMEGDSQRSRMASGALRDLGIPELIATDEESYVTLAVQLGRDKHMRARLGHQIRERISMPPRFLDTHWCGRETTRLLKALVVQ
jgi:predicted O-linked N-acetylglucosamine transferase (SPINDLY family)